MWRRVWAAVLPLLAGGCLGSEQPLFPSGHLTLVTPIKPGYYLKSKVSRSTGTMVYSADEVPARVTLQGNTYTVAEASGFEFTPNVSQERAQLSGSVKDGNFVAQIPYKGIYIYRRVDVVDRSFVVQERVCSEWPLREFAIREGWVVKQDRGTCFFDDAAKVSAAVMLPQPWSKSTMEVYTPVLAQPVDWSTLGAHLSPFCTGAAPPQMPGPALGGVTGLAVPHWRVIAVTDRPDATTEVGFAVEAIGDKTAGWAMIGLWDENTSQIGCGAAIYMSIVAYKPTASSLPPTRDPAEVRKWCLKLKTTAGRCGTHEQLIATAEARGLRILAEGARYRAFPDQRMLKGLTVTVMANPGRNRGMAVIETGATDVSRVVWTFGETGL